METATSEVNTEKVIQSLKTELRKSGDASLYVILDTAQDDRIYPALKASGEDFKCLYPSDLPETLTATLPHIVKLDTESELLHWLIDNGWGNNWGIYLTSSASLKALHSHFRQFIKVQTEDGEAQTFRFYDPRVLRTYLPSCNTEELTLIFGSTYEFFLTDDKTQSTALHLDENHKLRSIQISL